jgi:hypothetical protein|tara:strand:- start:105 stop:284 length:180 start_codon:yes stop_codon:yes gene_type:complete
MIKGMNKVGRKPKGWKPPHPQTLQIKKEEIKITFDDNIKGDLKDFMMKPKPVVKQAEQD